jgi:aminoglycoside 3-N-acetyltransferase
MLVRIDEAMTGAGAPTAARGASAPATVTRGQLVRDFRRLGITPGQTLLVHASLRSVGWVIGGANAVVGALREALGPDGNIVVPASTEANSDTSRKHRERIAQMTANQAKRYREEMPAFDPATTKSGAGAIAERVRRSADAVRSEHPQSSFAAIGPAADDLMADHRLESHLGEESPLAKLYKMDALVLMIGVGYRSCTAFHLAEYRYRPELARQTYACVVNIVRKRHWISYQDVVLDDRDFENIGESLEAELPINIGKVGNAECRLMPLSDAVDFAATWMAEHRAVRNRRDVQSLPTLSVATRWPALDPLRCGAEARQAPVGSRAAT